MRQSSVAIPWPCQASATATAKSALPGVSGALA